MSWEFINLYVNEPKAGPSIREEAMTEAYPESEVEKKLIEMVLREYGTVPAYQRSFIDIHKNEDYFRNVFEEISLDLRMLERSVCGPLLDVGSGCGAFIWVCRSSGVEAFGLEPDLDKIEIAKTIGLGGLVVRGVGEHLPFKDKAFELLTSMSVIEHVREPAQVIGESLRVISGKGAFHLSAPDYSHCFHEGHFDVFWLPLLPKTIAKLYLRLMRRPNREYISTIQYVTGRGIRKAIQRHGGKFTDLRRLRISYMNQTRRQWLTKKVEKPELIKTRALREIVHVLGMAGLTRESVVELCSFFYPVLSLARKMSLSASVRYLIERK